MIDNNLLTEEVLEAVKIIADGTIKNKGYDKTELCQITKVIDKKSGKYEVLSDQLTYEVWSIGEVEYFVNDQVYVLIPQNSIENKKFILGNKLGVENLMQGEIAYDSLFSLLNFHNEKEEKISINEKGKEAERQRSEIVIWEQNDLTIKGYPFVGIKIEIQSLLEELQAVKGNYGIKISLGYREVQGQEEIRELLFDSSEFIGNSYSFSNFTPQKKVFNISQEKTIKKIKIEFYQSNNFYNTKNEYIIKQINDNLKIKNLSLDFGINMELVESNFLFLTCENEDYYKAPKGIANNKKIKLAWLHRDEEDNVNRIEFQNANEMEEDIYKYYSSTILKWYRYTPDNNNDEGAGKFWSLISDYFFDLATSSYYKIEQQYDTSQKIIKNNIFEIEGNENINFEKAIQGYKLGNDLYQSDKQTLVKLPLESFLLIPNLNYTEEKIKVVLYHYNENGVIDNVKESNIIEFYNEEQDLVKKTSDILTAYNLQCEDNSGGNYFLYDLSNNILNASESSKTRRLVSYFNKNNNNIKVQNAQEIRWYIPRANSMLVFDPFYSYGYYKSQQAGMSNQEINSIFGVINSKTNLVDKYYKIIDGNQVEEVKFTNNLKINAKESNAYILCLQDESKSQFFLEYKISNLLSFFNSNNLITSVIKIDDIEYKAEIDFNFGTKGTSGTKTTLILSCIGNNYIFYEDQKKSDNNFIIIEANLYDENNNKITEISQASFEFEWYEPSLDSSWIKILSGKPDKINQKGLTLSQKGQKNQVVITLDKDSKMSLEQFLNSFNIVQCTVKGIEKFNLVSQYPIIKCNQAAVLEGWQSFQGITKIIADSSGEFSYSQNAYNIIKDNNVIDKNIFWRINHETKKYAPIKKEERKMANDWYYRDELNNNYYLLNNVTEDFLNENNNIQFYQDKIDFNFPSISHSPLYKTINFNNKNYAPNLSHGYLIKFFDSDLPVILIQNQYEEKDFKKYYNSEERIIEFVKEVLPQDEIQWNLEIKDFYYENTPLFGIQGYKEKKEIVISSDLNIYSEDIDYSQAVWSCPILILKNPYFSQVINEWDGKTLGIDEENGTLLSKMLSAGSKNEENKFSGVILGDWLGTNTEKIITKNTGLYGFHEGIMSFCFRDDGTANIGKKGIGQLQFNGNSGVIQSGLYELSLGKQGACLDFVNGKIMLMNDKIGNVIFDSSQGTEVQTEILNESLELKGIVASLDGINPLKDIYLVKEKENYYQIKYIQIDDEYTANFEYIYDSNNNRVKGQPIYISGFPITAGENFKVAWDGTLYANNGNFTGTIHAVGGSISGNMQVDGILSGAVIDSGKFNANFSLNGKLQKTYSLVTSLPSEPYNTLHSLNKNFYKFYKIEEKEYKQLINEQDKENSFNKQNLYELILDYIPGIEEDTEGYFPIEFNMLSEDIEIKKMAQIGILRAKTIENSNVSNVLGIKTKFFEDHLDQNLSIGFDSGSALRCHARSYSGLSVGDLGFNSPLAQIAVQKVNEKIEFIAKGIDLALFTYTDGETINLKDLKNRIEALEKRENNNPSAPVVPPIIE